MSGGIAIAYLVLVAVGFLLTFFALAALISFSDYLQNEHPQDYKRAAGSGAPLWYIFTKRYVDVGDAELTKRGDQARTRLSAMIGVGGVAFLAALVIKKF